jgi:dephospho-CoA kinase
VADPSSSLRRPFILGLTGSIAMGKTETGKMFARLGVPVYDADQAVHTLYDRKGAAVAPIEKIYPDVVRAGRVDRTLLAKRVTLDPTALKRVEAIVHPLVARLREDFLTHAARQGADLVVLDIPLLYETGGESKVDAVAVVSAPRDVQLKRVLARPGMTKEKLAAIEARQMPDVEKRARADFVIDTGKSLNESFETVKNLVETLRRRAAEQG